MPKTYYDSELTAEQIEDALTAIDGVVNPGNNGKVLCIVGGKIAAKSASEWGQGAVLEPLSVTANGDYTPPTGTDGFNSVHVAVPSATLTTKSITANGTYNASQDNADGYSSVTVAVPGGATVEPLEVTQNGTYNPPSGVDGYAPVTVNVSGGEEIRFVELEQGAFNVDGLNDDSTTGKNVRMRSTNYYPCEAGSQYAVFVKYESSNQSPTIRVSASFYSADDFVTPRIAYTNYQNSVLFFDCPSGANYFRFIFAHTSDSAIRVSEVDECVLCKIPS